MPSPEKPVSLDHLDDIPSLMQVVKQAPASPTRFRGLLGNSLEMSQVISGGHVLHSTGYAAQAKMMAKQAKKVKQQLADMSKSTSPRNLCSTSTQARSVLQATSSDIFRNYDINGSGTITYDDFHHAMIARGANLSRHESVSLCMAMDKNRVGLLKYRQLSKALDEVVSSTTSQNKASEPSVSSEPMLPMHSEPEPAYVAPPETGYERAFDFYLKERARRLQQPQAKPTPQPLEHVEERRLYRGCAHSKNNKESEAFRESISPVRLRRKAQQTDDDSSVNSYTAAYLSQKAESSDVRYHWGNAYRNRNDESSAFQQCVRPKSASKPRKRTLSAPHRGTSPDTSNNNSSTHSLFKYLSSSSLDTGSKTKSPPVEEQYPHLTVADMAYGLGGRGAEYNHGDLVGAAGRIANSIVHVAAQKASDAEESKRYMNSLIAQVGNQSKMKLLQHKMLKRDISNSGYINFQEFRSALRAAGVQIPDDKLRHLFDANSRDMSSICGSGGTLNLSSDKRGINVEEYIQNMQIRASAPALAHVYYNIEDDSGTIAKHHTPLEAEDRQTWKKIVTATSDPFVPSKRVMSFFKNVETTKQNLVQPERLREELNCLGTKLSDKEFSCLLSQVKKSSDGLVNMNDFSEKLKSNAIKFRQEEESNSFFWNTRTAPPPPRRRSRSLSSVKPPAPVLIDPPRVSDDAALPAHSVAPSYLNISSNREYVAERVRWSKLRASLQAKKENIYHAFGGEDEASNVLSEPIVRDRLYQAGVMLGDSDFQLLHSQASKHSGHGVTLDSLCEAIGVSKEIDSRNRPGNLIDHEKLCDVYAVLAAAEDVPRDGGVFGASEKSLLANPTSRCSLLTSTLADEKGVKYNRKRRVDPATGTSLAPNDPVTPSDFWSLQHRKHDVVQAAVTHSNSDRSVIPGAKEASSYRGRSMLAAATSRAKERPTSAPPRFASRFAHQTLADFVNFRLNGFGSPNNDVSAIRKPSTMDDEITELDVSSRRHASSGLMFTPPSHLQSNRFFRSSGKLKNATSFDTSTQRHPPYATHETAYTTPTIRAGMVQKQVSPGRGRD